MATPASIANCAEDTEPLADTSSIELADYLHDLELLRRDIDTASEHRHTAHELYDFRLKLDETLNQSTVQPEDKSIRLVFASIALIEYIQRQQLETVYLLDHRRRNHAPDKTAIGLIKEVINHLHFHKVQYHCEHYECVLEAADPLMPYLDEISMAFKHPSTLIALQSPEADTGNSAVITIAEMVNAFVQRLFNLCHGAKFSAACYQRKKRAALHFRTASRYLSKLPQYFGRLLVIRIDLHLPQDNKNMPIDELKRRFGTFLQTIRRKRSFSLKGYIWKLEYGFHQSFHYHCIFFLDGRKHAQDIKLAKMLGEIWDRIIEGEYCYFNCNHPKYLKRFQQPITGRLEPYDTGKYDLLLNQVIRYFCKKDQFIVHKSIANKKTFDTGRLPYVSKNLGRPRTHTSKY